MNAEGAVLQRLLSWAVPARAADWDRLFAEQLPRIYNFMRYRVGPDDAEDLVSETFERAWRARHTYRRDLGAFTTWLYAIARNVAIDHHRRRVVHEPLEAVSQLASPHSPEADAVRGDAAERALALLAELDPRSREIVALRYGAGLTNRAIGRLLDLTETNVGTILHRAIAELRSRWPEEV